MAPLTILVASYTDTIYTLSFDPSPSTASPSLKLLARTTVGHHPSWIGSHPSDKSLVFTALEQPDGEIVAIKYGSGGLIQGEVVARAKSGGSDPCTFLVVEDELIIGNYSSGTIATLPISTAAPYLLSPNPWTLSMPFEHVGLNKDRQSSSHPHQAIFNPLNQKEDELLVPDLGTDKVWRLTKRSDGQWTIRGHVNLEPGGGPRHVVARGNTLYTLLELTSQLAVHTLPPLPVSPSHRTSVFTLSAPLPIPDGMFAAEILLPEPNESFPGTFIYTSNRNDPDPGGDTIAIFSLAAGEDQPELVNEVRTGLNHVRGMMFGGDDDKYLIVGGVEGGGVKVFERVDGGKGLQEVAELGADIVARPTGFLWF